MSASPSRMEKPLPPLPPRQDPGPDEYDEDTTDRLGATIKSDRPNQISTSGPGLDTRAELDEGGRIDLWMDLKHKLAKGAADLPDDYAVHIEEYAVDKNARDCPPLNIVIFLIGSRGDIQPYIALALKMIEHHSHRVRIATHGEFKNFVLNANKQLAGKVGKGGIKLEGRLLFFDVGGDPRDLMNYMVKNPGLMPGWDSLTNGDVRKKKKMTGAMLKGFYRSTYFADPVSGEQFAADAIISNPPTFAHVHVAEALGLPLLMSFTMPWTPTTAYGHPLVNIRASNAEPGLTNYLGYAIADQMMWQGLGPVINSFRKNMLGLESLTSSQGAGVLDMLKIPWTYCWSDSLLPMPKDWKEHIDISGFYFFQDAGSYTPPEDLADFLKSGRPPVYIGFGSVPVENPEIVTETIYEAMRATGNRAIVSAGWAGLGKDGVPKDLEGSVYILTKDCPHDWLFAEGRLAAVCHHGGAGTTAIGLRNGLPSIIVPFFGDQKFWGDSIHRAGAGPAPVPPKKLNAETLAEAIRTALDPKVKEMAEKIGENIRSENGELKGVESFHRHLPLLNMRCDVDPSRVALWWDPKILIKLSGAAAYHLASCGRLDMNVLIPHRAREYETVQSNSDPILGGSQAVLEFVTFSAISFTQLFTKPKKGIINTFYGIPKGAMGLMGDLYDGFEHAPKMIGSTVREPGKVDGVLSGTYQGVKGLFTGIYDGVTGLVTEPMEGHKKEGAIGAVKGSLRSLVNVIMHPYRGLFGFFVLPSRGAARSLRKLLNDSDHVLRAPRLAASEIDAQAMTPEEKAEMTRTYDGLIRSGAHARKKTFQRRMRKWFLGDERAFAVGLDDMKDDGSSEASLSRRNSDVDLAQHHPHKTNSYPISPLSRDDPPPRFSADDMMTMPPRTMSGSSGSSRGAMGYQTRRLERHAERASMSRPASPEYERQDTASPPAFQSRPPSFRQSGSSVAGNTDTETVDSEVMRDLKDMFIAERVRQEEQ